MTIQELIDGLKYAVDELDFDPDSTVIADVFDENENWETFWNLYIDDGAVSEPRRLCINVSNDEKEGE